ncbi:MAG: hypothetical protein RL062_778 [Bacteroidota bacterium]|jgi:lipopolysaccharide export system permease protein
MIKTLDKFIIKKFMSNFLFMIGAFVIISVIFDISENIDDFLQSDASLMEIVVKYYLNFCFYFGNLLSSFIIFLTVIWFTSKMAQQSEMIAILSGGVSYKRILRPYLLFSTLMAIISLLLSHFIVPWANTTKYEFELKYIKKALTVAQTNLHREVAPGTLAHFYRVNAANSSGSQFSLEQWNNGKLVQKITAHGASSQPNSNQWKIERAVIRSWDEKGNEKLLFKQQLDTVLPMTIEDFALRAEIMSAMDTPQLMSFIDEQRLSGSGRVKEFEVELHSRTSNAFAIIILTIIGVTIASRKVRGGTGVHLLLAVVLGFVYVFISKVTAVSAATIGVPVILAVWIPNAFFAALAIFLYQKAQK